MFTLCYCLQENKHRAANKDASLLSDGAAAEQTGELMVSMASFFFLS